MNLFCNFAENGISMSQKEALQLFGDRKIRTAWNEEEEKWYFSIVDVVAVLTDSADPALYWRVLKKRLKDEGNETVTNCNAFKMVASDGKRRQTDVANQEQLFRLIQSIPSPKAEPFKQWMAQVAKRGGKVAATARRELEKQLGQSVVTRQNAKALYGPEQPPQIEEQ